MIRIGFDSPYNIVDNIYTSAKKTVTDAVLSSTDDIDNVMPDNAIDIIDIDFQKDNKEKSNPQNGKDSIFKKFVNIFSVKK